MLQVIGTFRSSAVFVGAEPLRPPATRTHPSLSSVAVCREREEFIEIGVINVGTQVLFDISAILPHEEGVVGQILRALFGYTSQPEVATFAVWLTYVVVVLALYLRPIKRTPTAAPAGSAAPARS